MRIGIFTDTYHPEISGVVSSVEELKQGLEELGHEVWIVTTNHPQKAADEKGVIRIPSVAFPMFTKRRMGITIGKGWLDKLKALNLDIIHTHTEFALGILGQRLAYHQGIPLVHTYHTLYEDYLHYIKMPSNEWTKQMVGQYTKYFCDDADLVITPTPKIVKVLERYGVKTPILAIPSGIDTQPFQEVDPALVEELRAKHQLTSEDRIFINVGRISREKSLDQVIAGFSWIHQQDAATHLILVGDGPDRDHLEELVHYLGLEDAVSFTGLVTHDWVPAYYRLGDIFISYSKSETQGLTYIESLAAGTPLLVQMDDCLIGVIDQKQNGYAFDGMEDFQDGALYVMEHLDALKASCQLGTEFTYQNYAKKLADAYQSLIKEVDTDSKKKRFRRLRLTYLKDKIKKI